MYVSDKGSSPLISRTATAEISICGTQKVSPRSRYQFWYHLVLWSVRQISPFSFVDYFKETRDTEEIALWADWLRLLTYPGFKLQLAWWSAQHELKSQRVTYDKSWTFSPSYHKVLEVISTAGSKTSYKILHFGANGGNHREVLKLSSQSTIKKFGF